VSTTGAAAAPRRTQAERRAATTAALLDAALDTLVERGSAGFTTTEVCSRAGLSQGALFRYFPTKVELLAAVCEHLFDELRATYEQRFVDLPPSRRTIPHALDLLWSAMTDPRLGSAFDLYTDARTDEALREGIAPVVRAHLDRIADLGRRLLDELGIPTDDAARAAVELAIQAMQGHVLNGMVVPDPDARKRLDEVLARIVPALLPRPTDGTDGGEEDR